jgi:hypothetical protein
LLTRGTPVIIMSSYAFGSPAPWLDLTASRMVALPNPLPFQP